MLDTKVEERKEVEIQPENGYLLVRQIEAPVTGVLQRRIASECWVFANVLDQADDINSVWIDTNIMFLGQLGIRIYATNDQGQHETRFLIEAKHVIAGIAQQKSTTLPM
jgi:hypothetical protein